MSNALTGYANLTTPTLVTRTLALKSVEQILAILQPFAKIYDYDLTNLKKNLAKINLF